MTLEQLAELHKACIFEAKKMSPHQALVYCSEVVRVANNFHAAAVALTCAIILSENTEISDLSNDERIEEVRDLLKCSVDDFTEQTLGRLQQATDVGGLINIFNQSEINRRARESILAMIEQENET